MAGFVSFWFWFFNELDLGVFWILMKPPFCVEKVDSRKRGF